MIDINVFPSLGSIFTIGGTLELQQLAFYLQ